MAQLTTQQLIQLEYDWLFNAREEQVDPRLRQNNPQDYTWWVLLAGRGFGKTRAGSEWLRQQVNTFGLTEVGMIGPSARELRKVMVEGGLLDCSPSWENVVFRKSTTNFVVEFGDKAICHLMTAENPDKIRGYNLEAVWMDELAAWPQNQFDDVLYNVRMATRKGDRPRFCVTSTPKPHPSFIKFFKDIRRLEKSGDAVITTGSTYSNAANLSKSFINEITEQYIDDEGNPTSIGKQEIFGQVLENFDAFLWTPEILEKSHYRYGYSQELRSRLRKVVVAVDPSGSSRGDEVGIVVFGVAKEFDEKTKKDKNVGYLIEDASGKYSPKEWAQQVVKLYYMYHADYVVGETNYGGDMVKQNVQNLDNAVTFRSVHATKGKEIRALPVAAAYERGRIKHCVGNLKSRFRELESQMCQMTMQGYTGDGSPDRMDALVWAVHETLLKRTSVQGVTTLY